jgi:hypothetical protein
MSESLPRLSGHADPRTILPAPRPGVRLSNIPLYMLMYELNGFLQGQATEMASGHRLLRRLAEDDLLPDSSRIYLKWRQSGLQDVSVPHLAGRTANGRYHGSEGSG